MNASTVSACAAAATKARHAIASNLATRSAPRIATTMGNACLGNATATPGSRAICARRRSRAPKIATATASASGASVSATRASRERAASRYDQLPAAARCDCDVARLHAVLWPRLRSHRCTSVPRLTHQESVGCADECSAHGMCCNGFCFCESGFVGEKCDIPTAASTVAAPSARSRFLSSRDIDSQVCTLRTFASSWSSLQA